MMTSLAFERTDELLHEETRLRAILLAVADEGNIVDHKELDALLGRHLNGVQDLLFQVGAQHKLWFNLGTGEVGREDVGLSG